MPGRRRRAEAGAGERVNIDEMSDEELERWIFERYVKRAFYIDEKGGLYNPYWAKNWKYSWIDRLPRPLFHALRLSAFVYLKLRRPVRVLWHGFLTVLAVLFLAGLVYIVLSFAANVYWTAFPPSPQEYVAAVNAYRAAHNVSPLVYDPGIAARAQQGANELPAEHDRSLIPPGCGEVLLAAYPVKLWPGGPAGYAIYQFDHSPMHSEVLLDPRYRYIGVGQSWRLLGAKIVIQLCEEPG